MKNFFDKNAKNYGERYLRLDTPRDILFSRRKNILIGFIKDLKKYPKSLADLGCGSGEITESVMDLKNNNKEFNEILLVDSSKNMLEISYKRIRNKFPKANINRINLQDEKENVLKENIPDDVYEVNLESLKNKVIEYDYKDKTYTLLKMNRVNL